MEIKVEIIIGIITLSLNILALIYGFAKIMAKLEMKPDTADVKKIFAEEIKHYADRSEVTGMIDERWNNHCPYATKMEEFDKFMNNRVIMLEEVKRELMAVRINTEMICDHLNLKYKK